MTIRAIYENGVFRPTEPVDLPEHSWVTVHQGTPESAEERERRENDAVWEILSHSVETGDPSLATRHLA